MATAVVVCVIAGLVVLGVAVFGGSDSPDVVATIDGDPAQLETDRADALTARRARDLDFIGRCLDPTQPSADEDANGDGIADVCEDPDLSPDGDFDGDGLMNEIDNCQVDVNPSQIDEDGDGAGDACDPDAVTSDPDGDEVLTGVDNCAETANPDQRDSDGDGHGDACDATPDEWQPFTEQLADPGPAEPEADDEDDEVAAAPAPTVTPAPAPSETPAATEPTPTPIPTPTTQPTPPPAAPAATPTPAPPEGGGAAGTIPGEGCIVSVHGAGYPGPAFTEDWGDKTFIHPASGNAEFPFFWLYDGPYLTYSDDDSAYNAAVDIVRSAIDANNCGPVMLSGASNGAAFVAKMYCRGEDFGGRLWAVHADDPVMDAGVLGCNPSSTVVRTLFTHSTELVEAVPTFTNGICSTTPSEWGSWYCEDDQALTLAEYEAAIGEQSVWSRTDHAGVASPETNFWQFVTNWWHDYDPTRFAPL